jgi:hypothetical protein
MNIQSASSARGADCQSAVSRIGNPPGPLPGHAAPNSIRRHSRLTICATLAVLAPAKIFACATCYANGANVDGPMVDGVNWAIFTLGVVVATVLGAFLTFFIYVVRKSEAVEAARKQAAAEQSTALNNLQWSELKTQKPETKYA